MGHRPSIVAGGLLALKRHLDRETHFMLLEADERTDTVESVAAEIAERAEAENSTLILAGTAAGFVGYVEGVGGAYRRNRTTAYVVMGVLASASGRGVGGALLDRLERWGRAQAVHRLELTVMTGNDRAIRLYERKGYVREGVRRECLLVDGAVVDELHMARLLSAGQSRAAR